MGGRTSGSGVICEADVGLVVAKERVVHCERGLGALRQACRSGVAIGACVGDFVVVGLPLPLSMPVSKSRDCGLCSCPPMLC